MSDYEEQSARIKSVFKVVNEIPDVNEKYASHYLEWLKQNLTLPCILTGIESMGYFGWEEKYEFGYGTKKQYEQYRKKYGSWREKYELKTLERAKVGGDRDILSSVVRLADKKRFVIPLSELQAVDESSEQYQILNDYTVWHVNY